TDALWRGATPWGRPGAAPGAHPRRGMPSWPDWPERVRHQLDPDLAHPAAPREAVARGAGDDDGDGHGRAVPVDDAAVEDGDGAGAGEAGVPAGRVAAGHTGALTDGMGVACRDDWSMCVLLPPETASMTPRVRPRAIGMAKGTAMRLARPLPRRRGGGRCRLSMQSTSGALP